ncbi:MAG TPA: hypothetical protein DCZ04_05205 [Syntrophorhabdus aromaticivorans]|nr:hypothetical protein [Syntrophorhabdus aromaticivorans]
MVVGIGALLLTHLFYPFTPAMGVPYEDTPAIAKIIGERIIETEAKSYQDLAFLVKEGKIMYERSIVIAAYALCGFAHVPSLAVFAGGTAGISFRNGQKTSPFSGYGPSSPQASPVLLPAR